MGERRVPGENHGGRRPEGAGVSARREYERRRAQEQDRIRERWGRFGGVAVALSGERQSTAAWDRGARGEELLGALLDSIAADKVTVLHDRRIPGSRANIDHLATTPAGVWVVDAKRYKGRPQLKIEGGVLRPKVEKLTVGRRDCTRLVDGIVGQVDVVQNAVPGVPVVGVLCFVGADWPLIGGSFTTREVQVLWPKLLIKRLSSAHEGPVDVMATTKRLAAIFKPA